jgi:hypothetical protein
MPRGGAVVHGAAALSSCASTESLEAIGRLTSGSQHLLTATPQGTGRHGFGRTPGARGATATECRMRHAQYSNRSFGGAHNATCKQSGGAAPELCRAPECARAWIACTANSGGAALVIEFGALRQTRACVSHVTTWPLVWSRL